MKKIKKIFICLLLLSPLFSCKSLQKSLTPQKKTGSEEFLVEKKSPLVMPPSYNQLPVPKINVKNKQKKVDIKEMLLVSKVLILKKKS